MPGFWFVQAECIHQFLSGKRSINPEKSLNKFKSEKNGLFFSAYFCLVRLFAVTGAFRFRLFGSGIFFGCIG